MAVLIAIPFLFTKKMSLDLYLPFQLNANYSNNVVFGKFERFL